MGFVLGLLVGGFAGAFLDAHPAIIGGGVGLGTSLGTALLLVVPRVERRSAMRVGAPVTESRQAANQDLPE